MARILILGGGFAAISAAERLAKATGGGHEIMLVSKSPDFTFSPGIVPMVFGDFQPDEIGFDLRTKLAERSIQFFPGEVRAINTRQRTVEVTADRFDCTIGYDYLLVAVGRRLAVGSIPGLSEHAHDLLTIETALKFKEAIAEFESGSIVIGLCPEASLPVPVCESALALAERFEAKIQSGDVSLSVVVPSTLDRAFAGAALFRDIEDEFERKGIRLVSDFPVIQIEKRRLLSAFGASLDYELLMLMPPFGGQLSLHNLGPVTDVMGFATVNPLMQVTGLEGVYAAGDIVASPGPKFGYMAIRQGRIAAANILAELNGERPAAEYVNKTVWAIAEKYTDPVFFHYGFWDETLDDFDEDALLGMARTIRARYGPVKMPDTETSFAGV